MSLWQKGGNGSDGDTAKQRARTCVFINKTFFASSVIWVFTLNSGSWPGQERLKIKRLKEWGMQVVRSASVTLKLKGEIRGGHF